MMLGQQQQTVRIGADRFLVYIPAGNAGPQALADCLAYAEDAHPEWIPAGVIVGRWSAVVSMLAVGLADIVVIAQRAHLPADRIPRVIAVEEELSGAPPAPRDSRRPPSRRPRMS